MLSAFPPIFAKNKNDIISVPPMCDAVVQPSDGGSSGAAEGKKSQKLWIHLGVLSCLCSSFLLYQQIFIVIYDQLKG